MKSLTEFIDFYENDLDGERHIIALDSIEYIKCHEDERGDPSGLYTLKMKTKYILKGVICSASMDKINV